MSGEKPTQFRLFQEESPEVSRKEEQALNPEEKLKSRGRPEDKIARSKEKRSVKKEIKVVKEKINRVVRQQDEAHLKFVLRQRLEGK